MDNVKTSLTIEEIDNRLAEISARQKVVTVELTKLNEDLGSTRVLRLPTNVIHKKIDALEDEQQELEAEQKFLNQERENIQKATAQAIAEAAAAEYNAMLEQLNPLAAKLINGLCALLQSPIPELEQIQTLMIEKAAIAGNLVSPIPFDEVITIRVEPIKEAIRRSLSQIIAFSGREVIEKAGVTIIDPYDVSDAHSARFSLGSSAISERAPIEATSNLGMLETARKAAGLPT